MKVLVGLVLLAGISLASANVGNSYFAQNMKWMEEIDKNGLDSIKKLSLFDFHITKEMMINAAERTIDLLQQEGYNTEVNGTNCGFQFLAWVQAIANAELWALEVFDATAKLNSGLARGNFRNPGHFDQCLNVFHELPDDPRQGKAYQGQMCIVPIQKGFHSDFPIGILPPEDGAAFPIGDLLPDALWLDFGICVPATCNSTHVSYLIGFLGLFFNLRPAPLFVANGHLFCHHTNLPPLTWFEWVAIGIILAGFAGVILATVVDMICVKLDVRPSPLTIAMSVYTNGRKLFTLRKNKDHIQCLYGMRALALIWLMYGYRHFLSVLLPLINPLDFVLDFATGYFSPWVTSFMFALDAILLLNGVHIATVFFKKMEKDGRVSIFKMYVHRYLKVTPYVAILILLLLTLTRYSSEGPYYKLATETQRPACETYFWSAVLHVQNYVNPDSICVLHTFLLSVDMQLFWASPLLLFPLYFWGTWMTVVVLLLSGLTVACAFTVSWFNGYSAFLLRMFLDMEKLQNFTRQIFFATHIRMGGWLIGIFVGYVLWKIKDRKSPIPWFIETFLWVCAFSGIIGVVYWIYPFQQVMVEAGSGIEYVRNDDLQNALYIGFARYIFCLSLGWMIYGCHTGSGLVVNWFFSLGFWQPFARMGLAIYLVSLSGQMVLISSQKTPLVFGSTETFHAFNGDMVIVLIFASLLYLMLEAPIMVLEENIYKIFGPKQKVVLPGTLGHQDEIAIPRPPPARSWY